MARTRRHTPDKWDLVERLHTVALDGVPCSADLAAEASSEIQNLHAWLEGSPYRAARRTVCVCGRPGEELEHEVYVCWTCRTTWRQ
jgi:hypothetical protein